MNILNKSSFQPINNFSITIGQIKSGWMNISIASKENTHDYWASYITDPLNDLLEATVYLLLNKPINPRRSRFFKNIAFVIHELESPYIVWLLIYEGGNFSIVIWDNFDIIALEDLCYYNLDIDKYHENEHDELPNLTEDILFTLTGSPQSFAKILLGMFEQLKSKYVGEEFQGKWGCSFSQANFSELSKWLADHPE